MFPNSNRKLSGGLPAEETRRQNLPLTVCYKTSNSVSLTNNHENRDGLEFPSLYIA